MIFNLFMNLRNNLMSFGKPHGTEQTNKQILVIWSIRVFG